MADATILVGGYLKRISKVNSKGFNYKSGFLIKFEFNQKIYVHVTTQKFKLRDQNLNYLDSGYFVESEFLKYLSEVDYTALKISQHKLRLSDVENGVLLDKVYLKKLKTGMSVEFCTITEFSWDYNGSQLINDTDLEIIIPPIHDETNNIKFSGTVAKFFYTTQITALLNNPNISAGQRENAAKFIALIAIQINNIINSIFPLFNEVAFENYITQQRNEWTSADLFKDWTLVEIEAYYLQITDYYQTAYSNQLLIAASKTESKLYWLAFVMSSNALAILPALEKVQVLKIIAAGTIVEKSKTTEIVSAIASVVVSNPYGIARVIDEEAFALRIVESVLVSTGQHTEFLNGLLAEHSYDYLVVYTTLFETLYDKINDVGGESNLSRLMDGLYKIWILSDYFPYNPDGSLRPGLINSTIYQSKPALLGYESSKKLLFINESNYDFDFEKSNINITEIVHDGDLANKEDVGTYGIYQAVGIKNTDTNTENIDFLAMNIGGGEPKAVLPIFYLKYIDDKKTTQNVETTISLTIDVLLTLTAVGNLAKLKNIRSLYKLGRVALRYEELVPGDLLASYQFGQGAAAAIEVVGSTAQIFLTAKDFRATACNMSSPSYNQEDCEFYEKLDNISILMQLFGGVVDVVGEKFLRKSAQDILAGPIPDNFNQDALTILRKFAGDIDEIRLAFRERLFQRFGTYDNEIWKKINDAELPGGMGLQKRNEFLIDFERVGDSELNTLNQNNSELVDLWNEVEGFEQIRKKVIFLKSLKQIRGSILLDEEIFKGRVGKVLIEGEVPISYKWLSKGVHHEDAFDVSKDGIARIVGQEEPIDVPSLGYYSAKVELYNPEYPHMDNSTGTIGWKRKDSNKGFATFFPKWSKKRLQQELALALSNKKYYYTNKGVEFYKGTMSDGVSCAIYIQDGVITSIHPSFAKKKK